MKVLHVLCDLSGGGAERLVLDLCRRAGPGVRAEVATVFEGGELAAEFARAEVAVRWSGARRGRPDPRALGRLVGLAREADLVHTHLWAGHAWGRTAGRLASRPVVSTLHNSRPDSPRRQALERRTRSLCVALVAVSEALAAQLRAEGEDHPGLRAIPNGVDLSRFPSAPPEAARCSVVALGRLTRQKGFDVLIRALSELPEATLELAGTGPDEEMLRELARPLGGRVRFLGFRADAATVLARGEVVALPSRWEGFGLVAVEAMAVGRPVVASRVDALPEVLGPAAVLVPPEDPRALAQALRSLLAEPQRRRELAEEARNRAGRFALEGAVRAYEALYHEVAGT